jgi:hypothetical protein
MTDVEVTGEAFGVGQDAGRYGQTPGSFWQRAAGRLLLDLRGGGFFHFRIRRGEDEVGFEAVSVCLRIAGLTPTTAPNLNQCVATTVNWCDKLSGVSKRAFR